MAMSLSCLGLILTLSVYFALPELRNLPGRILMNLSFSLLIAYAILIGEQLGMIGAEILSMPLCKALGKESKQNKQKIIPGILGQFYYPNDFHCSATATLMYFFFLSAFSWMTVMAFDVCTTFRSVSPTVT